MFDGKTLKELPSIGSPRLHGWDCGLAWHPRGRLLAASCDDRKIHIWDTQTSKESMAPLDGHPASKVTMVFNHAGDRILSTSWDRQSRLWDAVSGRLLFTMPASYGSLFGADDTTIGLGRTGTKLAIWRLADRRELRAIRRPLAADRIEIHSPVLDDDARILAASSKSCLVFFDFATGRELASVPLAPESTACPRSFDRKEGWMTSGSTNALLWPMRPDSAHPGVTHIGPPQSLSSSGHPGSDATPDGRYRAIVLNLPAIESQTVVLDRDRPGRRITLMPQPDVRNAAISPDGKWVVACSWLWDGKSPAVRVWDAQSGKPEVSLPVGGMSKAGFSPDGRWLATHAIGEGCQLWEVGGTWRPVAHWNSDAFQWSPNGRMLLLSDELGVIRFVEPDSGRELFRVTGPEPIWYSPAYMSRDGATLLRWRAI